MTQQSENRYFEEYFSKNSRSLIGLFDGIGEAKVLDMGCGNGYLAKKWKERNSGLQITAVELQKSYEAEWENSKDITWKTSDLFSSFEDNEKHSYDCIVFNGPHINAQPPKEISDELKTALYDYELSTADDFFSKAKEWLKPSGSCVYTFSDWGNVEKIFELLYEKNILHTSNPPIFLMKRKIIYLMLVLNPNSRTT